MNRCLHPPIHPSVRACLIIGLLVTANAWGSTPAQGQGDPTTLEALRVLTQSGAVRGQLTPDGSARKWLGIPFAEPPVGERRWQAPLPHAPWNDDFQADRFGSACAQVGGFYGPVPAGTKWGASNVETFGKPVGNEDCLTLNIWRPNASDLELPILVFVHGGSNVVGYSADPIYDGARLSVATNAVIVTVNYRLGIFGWFSSPSLESNDPLSNSGNFGTLDIVQALRFVKANAVAFGGDPNNVTVMGQSAGAKDVYGLIGSPLTEGLFQKAIMLSGLVAKGATQKSGHAYSDALTAQLAVDDHLATTLEAAQRLIAANGRLWQGQYLRSKSAEQLVALTLRHPDLLKIPREFNDGVVRPLDLTAAFAQGHVHTVPAIVGMTGDESKLLFDIGIKVDRKTRFSMMVDSDPDGAPKTKLSDLLSPFLLPSLGPWLYNAMHWLISGYLKQAANHSVAIQAKHDPKVFAYQFKWNNAPEPWRTLYGACHAIDLPFVFGTFSNNVFAMDFSEKNRPGREALSFIMMHAIAAFIRTGDPNNPTLTAQWYPWGAAGGHEKRLILNASDSSAEVSGN